MKSVNDNKIKTESVYWDVFEYQFDAFLLSDSCQNYDGPNFFVLFVPYCAEKFSAIIKRPFHKIDLGCLLLPILISSFVYFSTDYDPNEQSVHLMVSYHRCLWCSIEIANALPAFKVENYNSLV